MFPIRIFCFIATLVASSLWRFANAEPPGRNEIAAAMRPYVGPSANGVDRSTLNGKVMAGYQGWFTCAGDEAGLGWHHYQSHGEFRPGQCNIDLWPDVSELDDNEKFV